MTGVLDVLVLGGSVFLGAHVTRGLRERGHRVRWLNRGVSPVAAGLRAPSVYADRDDPQRFATAVRESHFEAVVDLSGYRPGHVLPAIAELRQRPPRHYVFCSSVAVYGAAARTAVPVSEAVTPQPLNDYGRDKLACERLLLDRVASATVLRLAPAFGPWDYKCRELFYLRRVRASGTVTLPDGGHNVVHLLDAAHFGRQVAALLGDQRTWGRTYNVATSRPLPLREYVQLIARVAGRSVRLVDLPEATGQALLGADFRRRWPHSKPYDQAYRTDALRAVVPQDGDLECGMRATVRWYTDVGEDSLLRRLRQIAAVNDPSIGLYDLSPVGDDLATEAALTAGLLRGATATGAQP
jgi:nucleoside-diphosphate-sugar epimerase